MMARLSRLRQALSTPGPDAAVEISPTHVVAATVQWERTGPRLVGHGWSPLPEGAVRPQPTAANVHDPATVTTALRHAIAQLPRRPTRIGLTLPDPVAKVSFVPLDTVPTRKTDLEPMLAWHVRKAIPFRLEDAQLAFSPGARRRENGREFIVTVVKRDIIQEYERICATAGIVAGIVDLTSFSLVNAILAFSSFDSSDWLLMHTSTGYCTLAIVRGEDLIFFRTRSLSGPQELADVVHQTAMYYEDHLDGRSLTRAVLVDTRAPGRNGEGASSDDLRRVLGERLGAPVEDLASSLPWRDEALASGIMMAHLASSIGLLAREQARVA